MYSKIYVIFDIYNYSHKLFCHVNNVFCGEAYLFRNLHSCYPLLERAHAAVTGPGVIDGVMRPAYNIVRLKLVVRIVALCLFPWKGGLLWGTVL